MQSNIMTAAIQPPFFPIVFVRAKPLRAIALFRYSNYDRSCGGDTFFRNFA